MARKKVVCDYDPMRGRKWYVLRGETNANTTRYSPRGFSYTDVPRRIYHSIEDSNHEESLLPEVLMGETGDYNKRLGKSEAIRPNTVKNNKPLTSWKQRRGKTRGGATKRSLGGCNQETDNAINHRQWVNVK